MKKKQEEKGKSEQLFRWGSFLLRMVVCVVCLGVSGVLSAQQSVSFRLEKVNLKQALQVLKEKTGVNFVYNTKDVDDRTIVSANVDNRSVEEALKLLLDQTSYVYERVKDYFLIKKGNKAVAPDLRTVRGIVRDENGQPLPGVNVRIEGTYVGRSTDEKGEFIMSGLKEGVVLVFSFIGYKDVTVQVGQRDVLEIALEPMNTEMEEVVVTGMFNRRAESFTGSATTVRGEDLRRVGNQNLLTSLKNIDPSFVITDNLEFGSDPNKLPEIHLRGKTSIPSLWGDYEGNPNQPLFILDGFETTLQRIIDLDPERVESITILKDAAGTALYGSRASNGVLVFETKKPKPGALTLSYSGNVGISVPDLSDYNLMNASEKLEYERSAGLFESVDMLNYYNKYKQEILRGVNTYWLSQPLRTAITHRHTLNMEGGDEAIRYSLSLNYGDEFGVMKGSDRNNVGLTLSLQYRRKKWNISNSLSMTNTKSHNSPYGSFSEYTKLNPYYRLTDENGRYQQVIEIKPMSSANNPKTVTNPLYNVQFPNKDLSNNFSIVDNFSIEYAIMDNLRVNGQVSLTKSTARSEQFKSSHHTDFAPEEDLTQRGSYTKSTGESVSWNANAALNYNLVKGKHGMFALLRWDVSSSKSDGINLSAKGFPDDNMDDFLFAFEMDQRVNGEESTQRSVGMTGSLNYMYDQRFSVDFNIRGDLSSQFGADTKMAPFWSVGLRWNMEREKWLEGSIISNLTLFGSVGTTGSQSYSPYQAKETYSFGDLMFPYPSGDVLGAQLMAIGNPDLGWSKTMQKSVSLEFGLWNSRLNATVSYYHNYTDEMLLGTNIQPSTGFSTLTRNVGAVLNEGVDVSLNGLLINNYENQFQWSLSVNATHNRNVIKKLSNELKEMNRKNQENRNEILPIYEEGESTTVIKSVRSLGIDPATGQELFQKLNGEKTFVWDAADKVPVGDTEPKVRGAVNSSLIWKNLSVNLGFSYQFGADRYNQTLVDKIENIDISQNVDRRAAGSDRWSPTNRYAKYKGISFFNQQTPVSTRFLQKLNEFVFNSVSIGYRFEPKQFKFLEACKIASLSLNASMQDIGRISSVKQERGLDYPFARSFNLSLSVLFN